MKQSVVISTYNQPEWLHKVLHGYLYQTFRDFELLVADDGSDGRTRAVIEAFRQIADFPVHHLWQEDDGFQKTRILNKAITAGSVRGNMGCLHLELLQRRMLPPASGCAGLPHRLQNRVASCHSTSDARG